MTAKAECRFKVGDKAGALLLVTKISERRGGRLVTFFQCKCDCGTTITKRATQLYQGSSVCPTSCGCLYRQWQIDSVKFNLPRVQAKHGKERKIAGDWHIDEAEIYRRAMIVRTGDESLIDW